MASRDDRGAANGRFPQGVCKNQWLQHHTWVDLGMTLVPRCTPQRSTTSPGLRPSFCATPSTTGSCESGARLDGDECLCLHAGGECLCRCTIAQTAPQLLRQLHHLQALPVDAGLHLLVLCISCHRTATWAGERDECR